MVEVILDDTHFRNPWRHVAPTCPSGHPGEVVVALDLYQWRCLLCSKAFFRPIKANGVKMRQLAMKTNSEEM